jgi:hypothetical protein
MSSKQQFKEALKGDKKIIVELKQKIKDQDIDIFSLQLQLQNANQTVNNLMAESDKPKWWQFWKQ